MKLPDFSEFAPFNELRKKIGAKNLGTFDLSFNWKPLTGSEVEELATLGLDVDKDTIKILPDGTLAYRNKRILIYIRDIKSHRGEENLPKFHIANCYTLEKMRRINRFHSRYVVATRTDGHFVVNRYGYIKTEVKLHVCKHCLSELNFNNYNENKTHEDRTNAVKKFSLEDFFTRYTCSPVLVTPRETDRTAPMDKYPSDWNKKSLDYRKSVAWKCEGEDCGKDLSRNDLRKFLHVHHINGNTYNCRPSNLKALCIACHSKEPLHDHVKDLPDFNKFKDLSIRQLDMGKKETDLTASMDKYPPDWNQKSLDYRKSIEWKCEGCGTDLSKNDLRKFLHVHHINGNTYNCKPNNLKALCVDCRSKTPT